MIVCNADKSGRVLTISHSQRVGTQDVKNCLGTVRSLMDKLQPGFLLLADLSTLESMDASCAPDLGAIMELCSAGGVSIVIRVIPDRNKDIGLALISRFHLHPQVKTQSYENLAEAIKSLLAEP